MALGPHAEPEADVLEPHELKGTVGSRIPVAVVTPKGSLVDRQVDEIVAPGIEGEFGVLPGHVAFLSALKAGVLTLRDGANRQIFAVAPGFLEVGTGGITRVLVESALVAGDIDVEAARTEEQQLAEQLRAQADGSRESNALLLARQAWAQARLAAAAADAAHRR